LERVGSIERIARAKSELVAALPADGLAVLNGDNRWTRAMATVSGIARSVLVGTAEDCQFRAADVVPLGLEGTRFVLEAEDRRMPVRVRVPGAHLVGAFLAAAATARFLDIAWDEIIPAIEQVALAERQSIVHGPDGVLIIDDSYNAAPMSMAAALDLLEASPGAKIAVLGDMLELGSEEEAAHQQVGERAARVADWLVVRGPRSAWIAEGAERSGLPAGRVLRTETNREAVEIVREIVRGRVAAESTRPSSTDDETPHLPSPRWAVLVKGSRGMRMEEVVQGLTERDR
jgi:UDP-N-acetylmuramoyl-tripeptide--D-alanyl-D-alanine ligase